jgi:AcrR family transcriptional regulator
MSERAAELGPEPRATKGRAPHRRNDEARLAILHAADDLLVERGYAAVTIEGIATRAGVAKQTIYRWWPSKFEILMDTFLEDADEALAIPDTGTTVEDFRLHLRRLRDFLTAEPAGRVMLALIGQAQHDEKVAQVFQRRYLDHRRARDLAILDRGIARGDVRANLDRDLVIDAIYGPIYHRVLMSGLPVDDRFIDGLVEFARSSFVAPTAERGTRDSPPRR